jgi:hypothetical protein
MGQLVGKELWIAGWRFSASEYDILADSICLCLHGSSGFRSSLIGMHSDVTEILAKA